MKIEEPKLRSRLTEILLKGLDKDSADKIVEYLLWADKSGLSTQGAIKLVGTEPIQDIESEGEMVKERETKLSILFDGKKNPAPLSAQIATDEVIRIAKTNGFGIVGVRNTFSSNGAQAYYVEKMAKNGLIGIMCSRSPASTKGFNSIDPLFGTNPIGFGIPTSEGPLVFDMATSAMTFYGLVLAKAQGKNIPSDMAIDKDGNITIDPEEAMSGAILPFDRNYKSSGLSMMVEMLAGPLLNSAWIDNKTFEEEWGATFIAISPELLVDQELFEKNATDMINKIKASRTSDGNEVRLPGESSKRSLKESEETGLVYIDDDIAGQLGF